MIAYRRRASALHAARPGAGVLFCVALALPALLFDHPLVIVAAGAALVLAGTLAGVGGELRRAAKLAIPLALLTALINPLVTHEGLTVVARLGTYPVLGRVDVTLEALALGAIQGLRIAVVVLAGALYSAAIDPDEVLRGLRRLSLRSALTASVATRLVPVLVHDGAQIADAQRCRLGRARRPGRRPARGDLQRARPGGRRRRRARGPGLCRRAPPSVASPSALTGRSRRRRRRPGADRRDRRRARGRRRRVQRDPGRGRRVVDRPRRPLRADRAARRAALPRSPGDRMSTLELRAVTYRYPTAATPALDDVSLAVEPGELVVLTGPSGGGKSTVLRAAAGLVPHFHGGEFGGTVVAAGLDTREHGPSELGVRVGSLFQDPETQVVMGTVRAEIAFGLENRGEAAGAVARGVEEAALALGVGELLDRSTAELSGGELQRVALAAALAGRPDLVLLDEPTSQLDPVAGDELIWLLRRLNEEWGTTIVLAEHRLERCLAAADRVVAIAGGRVHCDAPPRAFLTWAGANAPELQTPGARLIALAGLAPPPVGVKEARATLRADGRLPDATEPAAVPGAERPGFLQRRRERRDAAAPALELRGVWRELDDGPTVLRDVDFAVAPGERVALMGRNGAGKSTLLRAAAGLDAPTRGRVRAGGRVALLLQNPTAYLVHERVADEAPPAALGRPRPRPPRRAPPARSLRRRAPAPRPGHRRRRRGGPPGRAAARRADPRHGPRPPRRAARPPRRARRRRRRGRRRHPRRRARRRARRPRRAARPGRRRRRRPGPRDPRRRLVLRPGDRAHPARRGVVAG